MEGRRCADILRLCFYTQIKAKPLRSCLKSLDKNAPPDTFRRGVIVYLMPDTSPSAP